MLSSSLRKAGFGIKLLEIGTHWGCTALCIMAASPFHSITTREVDPIHVIIADSAHAHANRWLALPRPMQVRRL